MKTLEQRYVQAVEQGNVALRCRLEAELDNATADENDRLNRPGALRNAAAWYAKQGVPVFPCEPRGKKPLIPSAHRGETSTCKGECGNVGHGLYDATIDLDLIAAWWRRAPTANIGTPTGILFDVVDIDGPEGVASVYFRETPLNMPPEIGHSLTSRTAGHHVFIEPTGRGNKAGFMPGVDYRGKSGYVILPPSIGANGRRYRWTKPLELSG